jgi:hypothetical protein
MAQRSGLKASDEDREHVAERLRKATAEGRLLASELEQRLATALRARTYGELDAVVSDLPGDRPSRHGKSQPPRGRRRLPAPSPLMIAGLVIAIPIIVAAVIAVAVVLITFVMFWAVVALVSWRVVGHRHGIPAPWAYAGRRQAWHRRQLRGAQRHVSRTQRSAAGYARWR